MVEIVFDACSAGSLKAARAYNKNEQLNNAEILWFEWMFDIGYLDQGIDSEYRMELPGQLIMEGCFGKNAVEGIPEMGVTHIKNWETLKNWLDKGESIRVWYSYAPHALCGFYHLCTLFREYSNTIYGVICPPAEKGENTWYPLRSWGMVHSEKIDEYLNFSRIIPAGEIGVYAQRWDMLVHENAPLRAVISGVPTSVNEDFYDIFLKRYMPNEPFRQSELIGTTMRETDLGVRSSWYEYRVQKMIDDGIITVVKNSKEKMRRILKKVI